MSQDETNPEGNRKTWLFSSSVPAGQHQLVCSLRRQQSPASLRDDGVASWGYSPKASGKKGSEGRNVPGF